MRFSFSASSARYNDQRGFGTMSTRTMMIHDTRRWARRTNTVPSPAVALELAIAKPLGAEPRQSGWSLRGRPGVLGLQDRRGVDLEHHREAVIVDLYHAELHRLHPLALLPEVLHEGGVGAVGSSRRSPARPASAKLSRASR